jgi:hypothetical protein
MKILTNRILGRTESEGLLKSETRLIDFVPLNEHLNEDLFGLGNLSSLPKSNSPFENGEDFFRAKIYFTIDKANNAICFKHVSFGVDFHGENPVLEVSGYHIEKWLYMDKIGWMEYSINYEKSDQDYPVNKFMDSLKALIYHSARI